MALAPGRMRTNLRTWLLLLGLVLGLAAQPPVARAARASASASAPRTGARGAVARLRAKPARAVPRKKPAYPRARRDRTAEVRFGKRVADPYRWLEDSSAADTRRFVSEQNALSRKFLDDVPALAPLRARLKQVLRTRSSQGEREEIGAAGFTFTRRVKGKSRIYVNGARGGRPRLVFDEAELPSGYQLSTTSFSPDGKYMAYGLRASGSDWVEWKVRDVATGRDRVDSLQWTKFYDVSWAADGSGFFYSRFPEPKPGQALTERQKGHRIYFHRLGSPQYDDVVVVDKPRRGSWRLGATVIGEGRYLMISTSKQAGDRVELRDLQDPSAPPMRLVDDTEGELSFLGSADSPGQKPTLWFQTNRGADRGRVIKIDPNAPPGRRTTTVVKEQRDTLSDVTFVGDRLAAVYLDDASTRLRVFDDAGGLEREIELPGLGEVSDIRAGREPNQMHYTYSSFLTPPTEYRVNLKTGKKVVVRRPQRVNGFKSSAYQTRRVFVTSKDGTRVPMYLVHKKGLVLDGSNPTYLYGYGGFHSPRTPGWNPGLIPWLEAGGVYAAPALRGGGEYGEEWHEEGTRLAKQNVFDDFIASAEYLIASGITSSKKLAVGGGSNGGLLVGAAVTQRPELFAAAIPQVGVLDSLRYDEFTVGDGWMRDYGSPDRADEFAALLAYSPYHNVKKGTRYPATLIVTGDHDDRVVPAHSYKFAAALQHAQRGAAPVLLQVTRRTGHSNSGSTADRWAFLFKALGMK